MTCMMMVLHSIPMITQSDDIRSSTHHNHDEADKDDEDNDNDEMMLMMSMMTQWC